MGRPVTHWQILAQDVEKQAAFYGTLFDWAITADDAIGYRQVDTWTTPGLSCQIALRPELSVPAYSGSYWIQGEPH